MAFTNDSIFYSHTPVRQNENYTMAQLGAEEGLSYLSVDYFQPNKVLAPVAPNADVQSDPLCSRDAFIQTQ